MNLMEAYFSMMKLKIQKLTLIVASLNIPIN